MIGLLQSGTGSGSGSWRPIVSNGLREGRLRWPVVRSWPPATAGAVEVPLVRLGGAAMARLGALECAPVRRATRVLLAVGLDAPATLRADDGAPLVALVDRDDDAVAAPLDGALEAGACPSPLFVVGTLVVGGDVVVLTGSDGTGGSSGTLAVGTVRLAVGAPLTESGCGTLTLVSAAAELEGEIACPDAYPAPIAHAPIAKERMTAPVGLIIDQPPRPDRRERLASRAERAKHDCRVRRSAIGDQSLGTARSSAACYFGQTPQWLDSCVRPDRAACLEVRGKIGAMAMSVRLPPTDAQRRRSSRLLSPRQTRPRHARRRLDAEPARARHRTERLSGAVSGEFPVAAAGLVTQARARRLFRGYAHAGHDRKDEARLFGG